MTSSMGGLAADITTLLELQARLLALDTRQGAKRLVLALLLGLFGAALALASFPVALFGLAHWLAATWTGLTLGAALWISAGVGLTAAALLLLFAWLKLRNGLRSFDRSREELTHNIRWLKSVLTQERNIPNR